MDEGALHDLAVHAFESMQKFPISLESFLMSSPLKTVISQLCGLLATHKKKVIGFTVFSSFIFSRWLKRRRLRRIWRAHDEDVVVLHTLPRGIYNPCLSPFSVKLETFMKMMNIRYVLDFEASLGSSLKVPWITLNDVDYAGSDVIIQVLKEKLIQNPVENIPVLDRAIETSMKIMMEEHFYWGMLHWRYIVDKCASLIDNHNIPLLNRLVIQYIVTRVMYLALVMQGLGRLQTSQIDALLKEDLRCLSVYLGEKSFFHGDQPHEIDCTLFALLSQVLYNMPGSIMAVFIRENFPNLRAYTERMKNRYWGDWSLQFLPLPQME